VVGMMAHLRLGLHVASAVAFTLASSGVASATPIKYTEQAVASGSIGATTFSGANLTIQWTADTSGVNHQGGPASFFGNDGGASTVDLTISGVGSTVFTDDVEVFVNQLTPIVGFADNTVGASILDTIDSAFGSYALTTPIGPITDTALLSPGTFGTGLGGLTITAVRVNSTFSATPVPEPASLMLLGTGVLTLVRRRFRRSRER
jgi:hypothetical protein